MQTEALWAYEVENNDWLVIDGAVVGYVYMKNDEADTILLDVVDDEGEHTEYPFGPFDTVSIVAAFDDDITVEDIEVEV